MASCDNTVLTGQEGLIEFKPLGTTNCIDDYCPFGGVAADGTATPDRIYLPCGAEYQVGQCVEFTVNNIPDGEGQSADGGTSVIESGDQFYITDTGTGIAGDVDACGNDMTGIPYIEVAATEGGSNINWDNSLAGEPVAKGVLTGTFTPSTQPGTGYTQGEYKNCEIVTNGGGRGAYATVTVGAGGGVSTIEITNGGSGFAAGENITVTIPGGNGNGTDVVYTLQAGDVLAEVSGDSRGGSYTIRLCDFEVVCGVRSFSIDLSRDELDVTTLPCAVTENCGKELASFRKTQAGYATATGTLEVYFTCDQTSLQNQLLSGSLQRTQSNATVRLYVCHKTIPGTEEIDDSRSLYIEADIQLLGMSFSVDPDNPTTATINFGIVNVQSAFGLSGT